MAGWRVLALVLLTVLCLTAGCSSRSPLVNPAQTLPPRVPDSSLAMGDLQEWREILRANLSLDLPLSLFSPAQLPPPGPPPVPHFLFFDR